VTIVDADARIRALNPCLSFCVSAPAGSGKTELLIQRYLALLARVEKPAQVLAITFTRKAAAEMRERVLQALLDAEGETDCDSPHQQQTRELALRVLAQSTACQWNLVRNSSQFNIKTIDSYCGGLTRQMPVLSEFGGQASPSDYAGDLYADAVQELFSLLDNDGGISEDLRALMLHFDNDWSRLQELLVSMLARREQWSAYLGVHHQPEEAEEYLLHTVKNLVVDALASLHEKLQPFAAVLLELQNYAAVNLGLAEIPHFPQARETDLGVWRQIRHLLLTADKAGKWRAQVDKRLGFPAGKGKEQDYKNRLKSTIAELKQIDGLLDELVSVSSLPEIKANSDSWGLVLHLSRILPILSAQLLLVFQREGTVDHTQVALSALQALGNDDKPTELALRLDYQLQHILVDEFQDTAINQYELVRRLTRGWGEYNNTNPENPRSIMIVGDAMQSIYGFRNANVGLFLAARRDGFNGVALEHLNLLSNFRSDYGVVDWVNKSFSQVFPAEDNIALSQVSYTGATAVKPNGRETAVDLHGFQGDDASRLEVELICEQVQIGIADQACDSIAILARTRGHLQGILTRFKQLGIAYSAQDIDSLASSHVIVDLMSLCRALVNPADVIAWMAILRAPWCGLKLEDLHKLGTAVEQFSPWHTLYSEDLVSTLGDDGQSRLRFVTGAFSRARNNRDRLALRVWVEQLWLDIGGPGSVENSDQLHDAECFFQLLEQAEQECRGLLNIEWLETRLQRLFVKAGNPANKVQVMTLHKAKGLEFDWVIIPSMQKTTRRDTRPLLNWDEHNSTTGDRGFLLAANDHSEPGDPSLYNYLEIQRAKKELQEITRLLYVGATRAVSRLIMTACLNYKEDKDEYTIPSPHSLLGRIWPVFCEQMNIHESGDSEEAGSHLPAPTIRRVKGVAVSGHAALQGTLDRDRVDNNIPERSHNRVERSVGTVVHLILERLANARELPRDCSSLDRQQWSFELRRLGLTGVDLDTATVAVEASIETVLQEDDGRWLLSSSHRETGSELALTYLDDEGKPGNIIIDRTFIDPGTGVRWLIDYKNSKPLQGEQRENFLLREESEYYPQLSLYKRALSALGDEPIRCALYFTALGHLHVVENLSDLNDGPAR